MSKKVINQNTNYDSELLNSIDLILFLMKILSID